MHFSTVLVGLPGDRLRVRDKGVRGLLREWGMPMKNERTWNRRELRPVVLAVGQTGDVGFPSVCCEYHWLMNKAALGLLQHRIGQGRNSKQIEKERVGGVKEKPWSFRRRQTPDGDGTGRPQPYGNTQTNRNGLT